MNNATDNEKDDIIPKLTGVLATLICSILVHFICCSICTEINGPLDENFFLSVAPADTLTAEQELTFLEKRCKLILKSILQTVRTISSTFLVYVPANVKPILIEIVAFVKKAIWRKDGNEVFLPQESELPTRSTVESTDGTEVGNKGKIDVLDITQLDVGITRNRSSLEAVQKEGIFVQSLREWRSSQHGIDDDVSSSLYSPKECAICMAKYKHNDDICWSRNDKCVHVYHLSCMMERLMKHNECPMCRRNFLRSGRRCINNK